jgi:hypothetical protein
MKPFHSVMACLLSLSPHLSAQGSCPDRLLVSGYFSTVHVYDACTGGYLQDLDSGSRLAGAQAIRLGPDGLIYVVSELTSSIHRYRADTLAYVDRFALTPPMAPLGLAFGSDDIVYVAGYDSNDVKKFDRNGNLLGAAFPARASGIAGPEIGTTFGPDGNLYVPGYNSNSVIRFDPRTGATTQVIAPRQNGIVRPRGLLVARDGVNMFLMTEGSGQLFRWNPATGALAELRHDLVAATMLAYARNGELLAVESSGVTRLDASTGATLGTLVSPGSGGLNFPTFVAVIPIPLSIPPDTVVEFYNSTLDNYFITADPNEVAGVDRGAAGPGWARTGGTTPVCRFYGSQTPGPNSHFYTIDAGECQMLKNLQASTPVTEKRWNFESNDFKSTPPVNGACPAGTLSVFRAYNNGFPRGIDSNHRISSDPAAIAQVLARGWIDEKTVMCAPR